MIEVVILVVSVLSLALNVLAAWQRHATLKHHRRNGGGA